MQSWLGTSWPVYLTVTVLLMGGAAFAAGTAMADDWRSRRRVFLYCFLLSLAARFLIFALFEGTLLSPSGFLTDFAILATVGSIGYRLKRVRKMVAQYPWLYERDGAWRFRARSSH